MPGPTLAKAVADPDNAVIKSATNTQTAQANASIQSDGVVGNASLTNSNINWAVDQYIIFAIQNSNALDSTTISYFQIQKPSSSFRTENDETND